MTPDDWARARLAHAPGALMLAWHARADYLMWHSDFGPGGPARADVAAVNRAVVKFGGKRKMKRPDGERGLCFADVALRPMRMRRARSVEPALAAAPPEAVDAALAALMTAGLVSDTRSLDIASLRLSSAHPARLCVVCGKVTRHRYRHRTCHPNR